MFVIFFLFQWYDYNGTEISVKYVGNKFGNSTGLFADSRGCLFYVYERDHVILKWNPSNTFVAENVVVVLQNYSLIPYPVQIFADPLYRQLWVLNSRRNKNRSFVVKLNSKKND